MNEVRQRKILLLCAETARHTGTVKDHIKAFQQYSKNYVCVLDAHVASQQQFDLSMFDVIVFHYSIVISNSAYISEAFAGRIAASNCSKILFIQDEFRWVDRTMAAAERLGVTVVFTVVNADVIRKIYRNEYFDNVRFEQTLTGFVPEELIERHVPAYAERTIDVSYRARKLPGWCGSFALQKWQIGERFLSDATSYGLTCDIAMSEASRIYGEQWIEFVANSRAVLGTESGASFVDYTGQVYKAIDEYEAKNPSASFEEVREKFLEGRDGQVVIHVISPRVFEAACLRTLMILYPGDYSGVLVPWRHYVPLERDHSNMDEIVAVLRNPARASEIIANAYDEIARSSRWTFRSFIAHFDAVVADICAAKSMSKISSVEAEQSFREAEHNLLETVRMLEMHNARLAKPAVRRMQLILRLQRIRTKAHKLITTRLPEPIAKRLLYFSQATNRTMRPLIRGVLNSRSD